MKLTSRTRKKAGRGGLSSLLTVKKKTKTTKTQKSWSKARRWWTTVAAVVAVVLVSSCCSTLSTSLTYFDAYFSSVSITMTMTMMNTNANTTENNNNNNSSFSSSSRRPLRPLPPLYSNLSCPFEWSKFSCFRHGSDVIHHRAQSAYDYVTEKYWNQLSVDDYHINTTTDNTSPATATTKILLIGDSTMRQVFIAMGMSFLACTTII
jgi:hypothetical protein